MEDDYSFPDVEDLVEGEIVHCIMFAITWNTHKNLPKKSLPLVRTTIMQLAQANDWIMHRLKPDIDQVFMVIQVGPEADLDQMIQTIKKATQAALERKFHELKNSPVWGNDLWLETTDKYTLNKEEALND